MKYLTLWEVFATVLIVVAMLDCQKDILFSRNRGQSLKFCSACNIFAKSLVFVAAVRIVLIAKKSPMQRKLPYDLKCLDDS